MNSPRTSFTKLSADWNAEPNAPEPSVKVAAQTLRLTFLLNPWQFPEFREGDRGELIFSDCWRYRLGATNDEGWWLKQCRFSHCAPGWGEFYEVNGDLRLDQIPVESWVLLGDPPLGEARHFLFYFKDHTFECDAGSWSFKVFSRSDQ